MTVERKLGWSTLATVLFAAAAGYSTSATAVDACDARTDPGKKGDGICSVEVAPSPNDGRCGDLQITVSPDQLTVLPSDDAGKKVRKSLKILFKFKDETAGYRFCPAIGEGLFLKVPARNKHAQFKNAYGTDGEGKLDHPPTLEKEQDGCYKGFRVEFLNKVDSQVPEDTMYDYILHFRQQSLGGTFLQFCRKDPWVKNGK